MNHERGWTWRHDNDIRPMPPHAASRVPTDTAFRQCGGHSHSIQWSPYACSASVRPSAPTSYGGAVCTVISPPSVVHSTAQPPRRSEKHILREEVGFLIVTTTISSSANSAQCSASQSDTNPGEGVRSFVMTTASVLGAYSRSSPVPPRRSRDNGGGAPPHGGALAPESCAVVL